MKKTIKRKTAGKGLQLRLKNLGAGIDKASGHTIRTDFPQFEAGDTVRVAVKIKEGEKERIQNYDGVVIGKSNRGAGKTFVVRKISHGVGVERIFLESSQKIAKIEILEKGRVRRAKLYYLRGLEGRAAKIEREVSTTASAAQKLASKKA